MIEIVAATTKSERLFLRKASASAQNDLASQNRKPKNSNPYENQRISEIQQTAHRRERPQGEEESQRGTVDLPYKFDRPGGIVQPTTGSQGLPVKL
jgi:hypothetical protein